MFLFTEVFCRGIVGLAAVAGSILAKSSSKGTTPEDTAKPTPLEPRYIPGLHNCTTRDVQRAISSKLNLKAETAASKRDSSVALDSERRVPEQKPRASMWDRFDGEKRKSEISLHSKEEARRRDAMV